VARKLLDVGQAGTSTATEGKEKAPVPVDRESSATDE